MFGVHQHRFVLAVAATLMVGACSTDQEGGGETGGGGLRTSSGTQQNVGTSQLSSLDSRARAELEAIGDRVFFDYDKAELRPEGRALVQKWASWLAQYPNAKVTIEGHCDEHGTREYNLALGERRADAAKAYLVLIGVDAQRISTISYGKERPVVVGSNEAAWSQNRRAVMAPD